MNAFAALDGQFRPVRGCFCRPSATHIIGGLRPSAPAHKGRDLSARGPAQCSGHKWYAAAFKLAPRAVTPARRCGAVGPLPGALPGACVGGPRPCPRGRRRPSLGGGPSPRRARPAGRLGFAARARPAAPVLAVPASLPPAPAYAALRAPAGRPWPAPAGALGVPRRPPGPPAAPPAAAGGCAALALGPPARGRCGARGGPKGGPPWAHSRPRPAPGRGGVFLLVLRSFRQLYKNRCIRVSGPEARPEAPLARLFMAAAGSAISSPGNRSASKCGEYPGLSVRVGLTRQPGCDTLE